MQAITTILKKYHIDKKDTFLYGNYLAKIKPITTPPQKHSKLVLVTAISPTPAGEGKTTVAIGLSDAINRLHHKAIVTLREPSMGPVFGLKGGANGGGKAQVIPKDEIDLHFTGDMHAITAANNLIAACIDNHIYWGNKLKFDLQRISWHRVTDISDRSLRHVEIVIDAKKQLRYDSSFDITVASELMAVFCLANNEKELTDRINNIIVGYSTNNQPIKIKNLQITNAIIKLLNNAIWPNAVQSLEANLALIHGGPFANIAHGCNSILAIKTAMHLAEYTITEAGFGSDLGGEKFIDIVCRNARINPNAIVLVASIRSLKMHAGINPKDLAKPNIQALTNGLNNLAAHIKNLNNFGVPIVVAINQFPHDTPAELALLADYCQQQNVAYSFTTLFAKGSFGAIDLAKKVMHATAKHVTARQIYSLNDSLTLKLNKIVTKCYGADKVVFAPAAKQKLRQLNHTKMYVCVAKTPLTFSDDPKQLIPPAHFDIHIQDLIIANGANFIIALAGKIYRMPGLPIVPAATKM